MKSFNHQSGKYLNIDDAKIYYEEMGDPSLPVLLLLHGGLGNIGHFNRILARLPSRFRVIAIDSRGHGRSTLGNQKLSYELFQKEVEKVLKHLNITTLSILGFSNGGTVAYRLAIFTELKIQRLITVGSPWNTKHLEPTLEVFSKITVEDWIKASPADYEQYQSLNPEPNIKKIFPQMINLVLDKSEKGRPNDLVSKITCPLLITRGEFDPVVSNEDIIELSKIVKDARIVTLPSAGHEALLEQPDILTREILNFFDEDLRPAYKLG